MNPPCIHCASCCTTTVCSLGRELYGADAFPCPSWLVVDERSICSLRWTIPADERNHFTLLMAIHAGCYPPPQGQALQEIMDDAS